ncbi:acyl-CoA synthetase (AMP-forming)/AMP-acid ligase II [Frankia sp. EI5c]|uniref:class I adenylate-forming enzyme family protein n=1 Tax=Frankia sp. EI5c TaxID=683316 RepID=UPI0007C2F3A0|nr:class I adenylate-forming enzyme family protein [Frankia sp. EI5c]OAA27855.1 acyl-CoA synthetase (AMP-forming)/AMP-acid ligase II [Frankia sp. EI5c]
MPADDAVGLPTGPPVEPTTVLPEVLTIPALLATRRQRDGALQAFVNDDEAVTYTELDDASRALAARLVGAGVTRGSRVGLVMANGIEWATTALAVLRVGAVLVPLSTLLRPPELLAQLRAAAVTELVVVPRLRGRDYLDELESVAPGLTGDLRAGRRRAAVPSLRRVWRSDELPAPQPAALPTGVVDALERTVRPADDLAVLFTSGSRGTPKGVIHTHGSGLRAVAASLDCRRIGRGERLYIPMPFFWTGGFAGGLLSVLVAGATLLTEAAPEPARTLAFLERERVTLFRGWPDQAARLASQPAFATTDLAALRPASLPAVLPPAARPAPGARANLFGMTETFGPYCGSRLDLDLPAGKHGSCGRPFAGVEVRITDPDSGDVLPAGAEGEIRLRGPNLMRGLTGRDRGEVFDADGFYRTADRGVLDADGYLWYRGRLDDMFKVSGATVYPMEVEAVLRALPGVADAHVTDLPAGAAGAAGGAGGAGARVVAALVVTSAPHSPEQLAEQARGRLSGFKMPTRWLVVGDPHRVPRLASGKIDINALRRLLTEESVPSSRRVTSA